MSDPKKVKLQVVPLDSKVTLEFSGAFHKRLLGAYFNYVSKIETAEFEDISQHMKDGKMLELTGQKLIDGTSLETLLILISDLESKFVDGNFAKIEEFDAPTED